MTSAVRRALKGRTFYDILEIGRLSHPEEIRTAYLGLAKKYHPDMQTSCSSIVPDAEKFREIQEAYATLSNPWKKTLYDQDLQYQEAASVNNGSDGKLAWRENFNLETPEARIARRERYKRYAAGERNDLPPVSLTTKASLLGLFCMGSALTYVCAQAPNWFGGQDEQTYHDPVTDDHTVTLVVAFYNPITEKWERLSPGQSAPSFEDLLSTYKGMAPSLIERWEYAEKRQGNTMDDYKALTVIRVPKTRTIAATVYRDDANIVKINRRTLNEAIARFVNRISSQ
jgi:curved DNA-binding protein CbpA